MSGLESFTILTGIATLMVGFVVLVIGIVKWAVGAHFARLEDKIDNLGGRIGTLETEVHATREVVAEHIRLHR